MLEYMVKAAPPHPIANLYIISVDKDNDKSIHFYNWIRIYFTVIPDNLRTHGDWFWALAT